MPIIVVKKDKLYEALGQTYNEDDFQKLLFEYGVELDEVTSEREMQIKQAGGTLENAEQFSDEVLYKIELPANRYDILCEEGIVQALKIFQGRMEMPMYRFVPPQPRLVITVKKECRQIRPFVVCAALRNVKLDEHIFGYNFLRLQDKLHQNIGRRRTLVAIGTHDMDTLQPPFTYEALPPKDISFIPLDQTKIFQADELMEFYETEPKVKHLKPYVPIIKDSPVYPVIYDSKRVVLSLPPIINGNHSRMSAETKNIFIECTCTDHTKGTIVLRTLVSLFSKYCSEPFTIEPVKVIYEEDGREEITPDLEREEFTCSLKEMKDMIGIDVDMPEATKMLRKMQLDVQPVDEDEMKVVVPITRNDILQQCDIAEDLAIGYGYNNIIVTQPKSQTIGKEVPLNRLTDDLRMELATCGYTEMYTLSLISKKDNFDNMLVERHRAVELQNSKAKEFQMIRTSLIPCMLRALEYNQKRIALPIRFFEINDVSFLTDQTDTGAMNERRVCVAYLGKVSKLEFVHGTLDRIMEMIEVPYKGGAGKGKGYSLREADHPSFFKGRHADVMCGEEKIGDFGILHPVVLKNFGIELPVSIMEINIEIFVKNSKIQSLLLKK